MGQWNLLRPLGLIGGYWKPKSIILGSSGLWPSTR